MSGLIWRVRKYLAVALSAVVVSLTINTAKADDLPPGILNRTIRASYSESLRAKDDLTGKTFPVSRSTNLTISISSEGRISVRREAKNSANEEGRFEKTPDNEPYRYRNGALVADFPQLTGGGQQVIAISPDFRSCTISMTYTASRRWRSDLNGRTFTALGPTQISGEKCSITAGDGAPDR